MQPPFPETVSLSHTASRRDTFVGIGARRHRALTFANVLLAGCQPGHLGANRAGFIIFIASLSRLSFTGVRGRAAKSFENSYPRFLRGGVWNAACSAARH